MQSQGYYMALGESIDATCERLFGKQARVDHSETRERYHFAYIQHIASGYVYGVYMV